MSWKSCLVTLFVLMLIIFFALTWRRWQFMIIGYQLGAEPHEYSGSRVHTYLESQLVKGREKEAVFKALEPIPHWASNGFIANNVPDDTAECYRLEFPWSITASIEPTRTICFDHEGLLNFSAIHPS